MTIRHIQIFVEVYREMNVTRAADKLFMTQPAVTRAIKEIESYYGVRLFDRLNGRLYITDAGREFYSRALHIVDSFDMLEKSVRNWDELGVLRVGATITLGNALLPEAAAEFEKRHPAMTLKVTIKNAQSLVKMLLDNMLDIALIEGTVNDPQLISEPFYEDRLILIVPPDSELSRREEATLDELKNEKLLMREKGSVGRALIDAVFTSRGLAFEPLWESMSTRAIIRAVGMGLGIALLPEWLVADDLERGAVKAIKVADASFARSNYIVRHKNKYLTRSASEFEDICRKIIKSRSDKDRD